MKILGLTLALFMTSVSAFPQVTSVYTSLATSKCRTLELNEEEGGLYRGLCPGVGGYKLELFEGDLRQTINVIDKARKTHELGFWNISFGFSYVGRRVEWRMKGKTPVALIARFNVNENPDDSSKSTSYLIVAKITRAQICVTDVIKPGPTQNVDARNAADSSASRQCRAKRE